MQTLQRTGKDIAAIYERNADTVYRVCVLFFRQSLADVEDAVQTTFLRLIGEQGEFAGDEHEKAWLIVTASNVCRDMLASGWRRRVAVDTEALEARAVPFEIDETLETVMTLPDRYKTAIYMFYYEGYSAREIARHMGKTESSVWGYLHTGRKLIKRALKEEIRI